MEFLVMFTLTELGIGLAISYKLCATLVARNHKKVATLMNFYKNISYFRAYNFVYRYFCILEYENNRDIN